MQSFWDNPPSRNNRIGCCGETASSENWSLWCTALRCNTQSIKRKEKNAAWAFVWRLAFVPPSQVYIYIYIWIYCDWNSYWPLGSSWTAVTLSLSIIIYTVRDVSLGGDVTFVTHCGHAVMWLSRTWCDFHERTCSDQLQNEVDGFLSGHCSMDIHWLKEMYGNVVTASRAMSSQYG